MGGRWCSLPPRNRAEVPSPEDLGEGQGEGLNVVELLQRFELSEFVEVRSCNRMAEIGWY